MPLTLWYASDWTLPAHRYTPPMIPTRQRDTLPAPLSYTRSKKRGKPVYAPVLISESGGIRYLHFGTEWIQGAMRLSNPNKVILSYAKSMLAWLLFVEKPERIAQLGLGTGALTKFCYHFLPRAHITAVELNPEVVSVCNTLFCLPPQGKRLSVLMRDAMDFVRDRKNHGVFDVLQVDLYDATARGPVWDTPEFYMACRHCLRKGGVLSVNLFGVSPCYERNKAALARAFPLVLPMPPCKEGNIVVLAFEETPVWDSARIEERARQVWRKTGLPAMTWLRGLRRAIAPGTGKPSARQ
ncbi:MAG: spermidine synthase [Burkholderiaceae bacterium]|nr:spermidine synthase [Burkholderiaceae bacterium]